MKIIKLQWIDWIVLFAGFILTGVLSLIVLLGSNVGDGQTRIFYKILGVFLVLLSQAGLLISPWAIKHTKESFKIAAVFAMLPSILFFILMGSDSPKIIKKGLVLDNIEGIINIIIFSVILLIYGCQIIRLLKSMKGKMYSNSNIQNKKVIE